MFIRDRLAMYLGSECLLGIPWGLFQAITLPYVFDICPLQVKGPVSVMLNGFWLLGQIVCSGILRGSILLADTMWQVRVPMFCQYAWIWILALIVLRAPESPMFLIRSDRNKEATGVLRRLNRDPEFDEEGHLEMLCAIDQHEKDTSTSMGFFTCFSKYNIRRTEIAIVVYSTQQLVGSPLVSYSVAMLQKGGLGANHALEVNMAMYIWCFSATLGSIYGTRKLSRRTLWLGGLAVAFVLHLISGTLAVMPNPEGSAMSYVIAVVLVLFAGTYNFTVGPVGYAIVGEVPSTRLKTATNALARGAFILVNVVNLFLVPMMLTDKPEGWGLGARTSFLYAITTAFCFLWGWYRLPETKGLTPAQIDHMFDKFQRSQSASAAETQGHPKTQ